LVNKRLGLGSEVFDGNFHHPELTDLSADLIDVDDLAATPEKEPRPNDKPKSKRQRQSKPKINTKLPTPSHQFDPQTPDSQTSGSWNGDGVMTPTEGMSARQLNVLKRKAKMSKSTAQKYNQVIT
jgi:hypothetical protein